MSDLANRVTKVTLTAQVAQYVQAMEQAAKATSETGSAAAKLAQQADAVQQLGRATLAIGVAAAAGVGLAVAKFAEFDAAMSNVQAATHESAENMALLRDAALDAGDRTVFSAAEAANAIEELGKAGLTTQQILEGGLDGALNLAAAGGLEVAEAASAMAISLKQFNLEGSDAEHVADLMAAGAGKAVGDVTDLSAALNQAGLVANGAGHSIEDTTGVLAAFADAGLLGSDAGTSLKSAMIALQAPTAKAQAVMADYGLSFYDANGQMRSFDEIAGQLKTNLGSLSDEQRNSALATIFGNDALRVANVLYDEGATGIAKYIEQTNDAGYAAETARIRLDNLNGDVEKLGGALDSTFIKTGSAANDSLRSLTQGATWAVSEIGALPEPVLAGGLALTGLVGVVGLMGGAALLAVPKVAEFRAAMTALNLSGGGMARTLGGVTGALALAGAAFAVWADRQADAAATTADLQATLDESTGAITKYTRELVAKQLAEKGVFDAAKDAGISQKELTDAVLEGGVAYDELAGKIAGNNNIVNFFTGVGVRAGDATRALNEVSDALPRAAQNLADERAAADGSAESTESAAEAYMSAADSASALQSNLQGLIDTVNEANGVGQDAVSANSAYQDAMAGVQEAVAQAQQGVDGFSTSVDESTAAGAANAAMFAELASKSQAAAAAQLELDGDTQKYRGTLEAGRQALYDQILGLTGSAEAAQALTDKVYAMPSQKQIDIIAETQAAQAALDRFVWANDGRSLTMYTDIVGRRTTVSNDGGPGGFKDGGQFWPRLSGGSPTWWRDGVVQGPGGPRDDMVNAMLSPGEFVVNADATNKHLEMLNAINSGTYRQPNYGTYANMQFAQAAQIVHVSEPAPVNYSQTFNVAPIKDNDPHTSAVVIGREAGRYLTNLGVGRR